MSQINIKERMLKILETWKPHGRLLGLDWGREYDITDYKDDADKDIFQFEFVIFDDNPYIDDQQIIIDMLNILREEFKDDPTIKILKEYGDTVEIYREKE